MENKTLTLPIYIKAIYLLFSLGSLFCIIFFRNSSIVFSVIFLFNIVLFSILFYFSSVKYIFNDNKIIIKYPYFYSKEYNINNIIGYAYTVSSGEIELTLFMNNDNKVKIKTVGKMIKEYINNFINNMNGKIQNNNIDELKNKGIEYNFSKNRKLLFTVDYIEILEKNIQERYYYKNDMKNILLYNYNGGIYIKIFLNNKKTLNFNDYGLKGKIGLIKYLEEQIKTRPNVV
jgi:hypothetical protein